MMDDDVICDDDGKSMTTHTSSNNHKITNTWSCASIFCRHTKHIWNYGFNMNMSDLWLLNNYFYDCASEDHLG